MLLLIGIIPLALIIVPVVFLGIKDRCLNPKNKRYYTHGGRGITVCDSWMKFENFIADMGLRPSDGRYTIERKDNDGNYEAGNCYWATYTQQNRNRRNNRIVIVQGQSMLLREAAKKYGVPYSTVWGRSGARGEVGKVGKVADRKPPLGGDFAYLAYLPYLRS